MEDSRNIIKAIDALTLKAGGGVVDSKNITEAIDRLKAVYDQEAIGIDKTLTQEGLAADAKAVGDVLNTKYTKLLTKVNENISNVEIRVCIKVGNIAMVSMNFTVASTITGNTDVLFSGAFIPAYNNIRFIAHFVTANANGKNARIAVSNQGNITNWYTPGGITPDQYEATFVYITG